MTLDVKFLMISSVARSVLLVVKPGGGAFQQSRSGESSSFRVMYRNLIADYLS